jgi:hypothetical protein
VGFAAAEAPVDARPTSGTPAASNAPTEVRTAALLKRSFIATSFLFIQFIHFLPIFMQALKIR